MTTAAEPGVSSATAEEISPRRPELTHEQVDHLHPRPATLASQEIRLALAFTGGVSLAVWMGGVARELNLLAQASELRRTVGTQDPLEDDRPGVPPVLRCYRRLLDLVDAQISIDVLAGTSAGGINAALLGMVTARWLDLGPLRDIWLKAGDIGRLMRDPAEHAPPSLLKGDGEMLASLNEGIAQIAAMPTVPGAAPPDVDVFITTTLLSPETSRFTDDYGTQIADTDHQGLFHFTGQDLKMGDVLPALGLAARSSASFPAAFEPSFVPYGADSAVDPAHPDMSPWFDATCAHWVADGGLLANRPIAPLLQTVFDREADREVRRALLYIVPTTSGTVTPAQEDRQASPPGLADALRRDLDAVLNQSIAADLAAIREHNDRIRAAADTGLRMAGLGNRLGPGRTLADEGAWRDYRERQGDWFVTPLISEVGRELSTLRTGLPPAWAAPPGRDQDVVLRTIARDEVTAGWPSRPPRQEDVAATAIALGRPAFDNAKARMLRLLTLGRILATTRDERNRLAKCSMHASRPLAASTRAPLRRLVQRHLRAALQQCADPLRCPPLETVVRGLARDYVRAQGTPEQLRGAWSDLAETYRMAAPLLRRLVDAAPPPAPVADAAVQRPRPTLRQRRTLAAAELGEYLTFFDAAGEPVGRFLDLHVAVRSVLPVLTQVAQRVELVQVSADTRTRLSPHHDQAARKLTGLQLHHFGAFYKPSWRANDWMWGRLDGCGWLVHLLLDPRRILSVMENDGEPGSQVDRFFRLLHDAVGVPVPRDQVEDLAFLDCETAVVPASLPRLALWVAGLLQEHIAAEELPVVAAQVRAGLERSSRTAQSESAPSAGNRGTQQAVPPGPEPRQTMGDGQARRRTRRLEREVAGLQRECARLRRKREGLAEQERTKQAKLHQRHQTLQTQRVSVSRVASVEPGYQGRPSTSALAWLAMVDDWKASAQVTTARLLDTCPVGAESISEEARSGTPLFLRTATHAAAVATAAGTGIGKPPASLRPTVATARTVTRTAYIAANRAQGRRRAMTFIGLGLLTYGVLALLADVSVLGVTGLVAFGSGAVVLAFVIGPTTIDALRILLALALILLAAAPWLPWLDDRVFPWLSDTALPWVQEHPWTWPALLFLVLLPPASAVGDLLTRRRRARAAVP